MKACIWIAAAMMTVVLAGCGPAGKTVGKTTVGTRTFNTEWKSIPTSRLLINFGDLGSASVTRTEERIRDNSIVHQRVRFDGGGSLFLEHLSGPNSIYTTGVTDRHNSISKVVSAIESHFRTDVVREPDMEQGRIRRYGSRGGWVGRATEQGTGADCVVARMAFLSRATKNRGTDERYDTVVEFRDCSGKRTLEDVKKFLTNVRIVSRA